MQQECRILTQYNCDLSNQRTWKVWRESHHCYGIGQTICAIIYGNFSCWCTNIYATTVISSTVVYVVPSQVSQGSWWGPWDSEAHRLLCQSFSSEASGYVSSCTEKIMLAFMSQSSTNSPSPFNALVNAKAGKLPYVGSSSKIQTLSHDSSSIKVARQSLRGG